MDDTPEPGNPFLQNDNKVQILSLGDVLLGILFTLLVNIWWIILLLVVLNLIDRHRFREYITKHPPGSLSNPPVFFRPLLFWHGQGSSWYRRMLYLVTEAPYEDDDDFEDDGDQPGPDGTGGAQENAYTGPGPDVGPQASGFRGRPPGSVPPGAPRPLGNVEPPLGHGVGMGAPAPGPSQPPVRWAAHVVPFPLSFGIPWAEVSSFPGFFAPALKRQPHRLEILSRTGGVFRPFLAFSPHASGVFASSTGWGGRSPFTATQRLILVPMLWNFSS